MKWFATKQHNRVMWSLACALACFLVAADAFGQNKGKGGGKGGGGGGEPPADPAIAYISSPSVLSVMNADGSNQTEVFSLGTTMSDLSWSPDGGSIAFRTNPPSRLFVIDVSVVDGVPTAGNLTKLFDIDIDDRTSVFSVAWSPVITDEIAIVTHKSVDGSSTGAIFVISRFRVPGDPLPEPLYTAPPDTVIWDVSWRADGSQIAFTAGPRNVDLVLYVLDLATGVVRDIHHGNGVNIFYAIDWARTNDEIALTYGNYYGSFEPRINIVDIATGAMITVIEPASSSAWSPDDTRLAYTDRTTKLKTVDLATGAITKLTRYGLKVDWRRF